MYLIMHNHKSKSISCYTCLVNPYFLNLNPSEQHDIFSDAPDIYQKTIDLEKIDEIGSRITFFGIHMTKIWPSKVWCKKLCEKKDSLVFCDFGAEGFFKKLRCLLNQCRVMKIRKSRLLNHWILSSCELVMIFTSCNRCRDWHRNST